MVGPRSLGLYLPSQTKASRVKDACGLDARQKYYHFPFVRGINGAPLLPTVKHMQFWFIICVSGIYMNFRVIIRFLGL